MSISERAIKQVIRSHASNDGADVKIQRVAGFQNALFSPFLMIDELKSDDSHDNSGGFPPHPHRGIETLTYLLNGHLQHKDQMGNVGEVRSGGAQWMAAGRGVIHSEMPLSEDGFSHGFQIWINQLAKLKMAPAQYWDIQSESITDKQLEDGSLLRVIAGDVIANDEPISGPLDKNGVPLSVSNWQADGGKSLTLQTPSHFNMMLYVYSGSVQMGDSRFSAGELVLFDKGDYVQLSTNETSGVLLLSGEPINEPVVHYGPFVMNSMEEIEQTIHDFNSGVFETYK